MKNLHKTLGAPYIFDGYSVKKVTQFARCPTCDKKFSKFGDKARPFRVIHDVTSIYKHRFIDAKSS